MQFITDDVRGEIRRQDSRGLRVGENEQENSMRPKREKYYNRNNRRWRSKDVIWNTQRSELTAHGRLPAGPWGPEILYNRTQTLD